VLHLLNKVIIIITKLYPVRLKLNLRVRTIQGNQWLICCC